MFWLVQVNLPRSWLRIGCGLGSRNVTFCRVLHTQLLEVIDSPPLLLKSLFEFPTINPERLFHHSV